MNAGLAHASATPAEVLRSLLFYGVFYPGSVVFVLGAMVEMALRPGPPRWFGENWSRFHGACVRRILGIVVRIEGEVPRRGVLVALKHESFFEAISLPALLDLPVVFAKAELLDVPLWGLVAARYGVVPVERDQGARALRAMVATARAQTADGRLLAIFPEGTRVPHGTRPALQSGFAALYKLLGRAVVPVAIDSGALYHRRWKRRGTITIRFGAPIAPGLSREVVEARVRVAINALNPVAEISA